MFKEKGEREGERGEEKWKAGREGGNNRHTLNGKEMVVGCTVQLLEHFPTVL